MMVYDPEQSGQRSTGQPDTEASGVSSIDKVVTVGESWSWKKKGKEIDRGSG